MDKPYDKFNIMLIGDEKVGKSTLLERYFNKKFNDQRKQTLGNQTIYNIGVECYDKTVEIENKKYLIKVWDTAGQEKFAVMARSYYKRAHGMIIACAINNRSTFENLRVWLNSVKENAESEIQIILLANKCDLEEEREVKKEEIKSKADELGIEFFETSAKTNFGVDEAFNKIIDKVFKAVYSRPNGISLDTNTDNQAFSGKRCC